MWKFCCVTDPFGLKETRVNFKVANNKHKLEKIMTHVPLYYSVVVNYKDKE